jgi:hypothetical protein
MEEGETSHSKKSIPGTTWRHMRVEPRNQNVREHIDRASQRGNSCVVLDSRVAPCEIVHFLDIFHRPLEIEAQIFY